MLTIEGYISQRKKEDKVNEFDLNSKMNNLQLVINYVFDYFNYYLETNNREDTSPIKVEQLQKYRKQMRVYSPHIQNWLVEIYDTYGKQLNRSISSCLKKQIYFYLYNTDDDFTECADDCYIDLIDKHPYITKKRELLYQFIREYHSIHSQADMNPQPVFLTEGIYNWINDTWDVYKVNIWTFASHYLYHFSRDYSSWPLGHAIKSGIDFLPYFYDHKQETNLFNLNQVFAENEDKPFLDGKKKHLEMMLMYIWLNQYSGDKDYWEEYIGRVLSL